MDVRKTLKCEDTEQIAVVEWAKWHENEYPILKWLHHCPNGGSRNRLEAIKLKQMGVKAGVSDLCLPYTRGIYTGLYIEMKYGKNKQQDSQKEFLKEMMLAGHFVTTCYSAEDAIKVLEEYCSLYSGHDVETMTVYINKALHTESLTEQSRMKIPNNSILKDGKIL